MLEAYAALRLQTLRHENQIPEIIEIGPNGMLDKLMTYDEFIADPKVAEQRAEIYGVAAV